MKSKINSSTETGWYLSYEVLYFEYADKSFQDNFLLWENHVLIQAKDAEEAFTKAIDHGRLSEEELLINNKRGFCRFKGIRKLVAIYEELEDGAEIEWREFELSKDDLEKIIPLKETLHAFQP